MFNKNAYLLVILLLFILQISFVTATEYNETDIIEIDDNTELSINDNSCERDYVTGLSDVVLDLNQGDKIPITIDSPVDGKLTVLVDDEFYNAWSFSKNKTILIPTYNPDSFYDDTMKNINVGSHKLSLIFKLNTFNNYIPVSNKDSNLTFKFNTCNNTLNSKYTYTHTATLNIHEKEKTIHLSLNNKPKYYSLYALIFDVQLDNVNITDLVWENLHTGYVFGVILSDDKGIILKKDMDMGDTWNLITDYDEWGMPYMRSDMYEDAPCINYDVVRKLGVCNLTVVNFEDGTFDCVLFEVSKFSRFLDALYFEVIDSEFIVSFYNWRFPDVFISVDYINKVVSPKGDNCNVTFSLSPGMHVMTLYCPESDFTEEFTYNLTFIIGGTIDIPDKKIIIPELYVNNTSFNMFNGYNFTILGGDLSDSSYGVLSLNSIQRLKQHSTDYSSDKIDGESMTVGDNNIAGSSSTDDYHGKSYEISKHISKSKDNLLTKIGLTIISCMSLMVGYSRFEKNQ